MAGCMVWMMSSKIRICGRARIARASNPHDMSRGKDCPGGSDVGLDSLRERVVVLQLGEAQGPPDVAVKNTGSPQDDIILDRALKECEL